MSDPWTERLSDYLDDGLDPEERQLVEAHLAVCEPCAATLADLRRVAAQARTLEELPPPHDLWPGIAARIGAQSGAEEEGRPRRAGPPRRFSFSIPQLVAAGLAVMFLSGGAVYVLRGRGVPAPQPPAAVTSPLPSETVPAETPDDLRYDAEVASLERALAERGDELDTTTVRVLRENLKLIKLATAEARRALAADPSNAFLRDYLEDEMMRKLKLLQRAAVTASLQE